MLSSKIDSLETSSVRKAVGSVAVMVASTAGLYTLKKQVPENKPKD